MIHSNEPKLFDLYNAGVRLGCEWLIWAENNLVLKKKENRRWSFGLRLAEKRKHSSVKGHFHPQLLSVILASSDLEIPPPPEGGYVSVSPAEPKISECPGSLCYLSLL